MAPLTSRSRKQTWRTLPRLLQLLILTQFAFNIGFFAVLPFLAVHLGTSIGMAGWLVGLVLGLRTFSQQGGALTDRYGVRPVVLTGCVTRIAGFVWLGFAQGTAAVISAVLLVGFAAALFSPAVESEVARQAVSWEHARWGVLATARMVRQAADSSRCLPPRSNAAIATGKKILSNDRIRLVSVTLSPTTS